MRLPVVVIGAVISAWAIAGYGQTTATCDQTLTAPLHARSMLNIDSRPAGLEIVGTDEDKIHVTCHRNGTDDDNVEGIRLRFSPNAVGGKLSIDGQIVRRNNGVQIRIEVPKKTSLTVRMFAGQVTVEQISGDKDISVGAGQITISNHNWNYRSVDASVGIGQVNAPMYDQQKGGFFRSVTKSNQGGEYRLRAHVNTGQIDLQGKLATAGSAPKPD